MTLDKQDQKFIKEIINDVETRLFKEIGFLRLEMNKRFEETNERMDKRFVETNKNIEQIKNMESEDVAVLYKDVAMLKKKLSV